MVDFLHYKHNRQEEVYSLDTSPTAYGPLGPAARLWNGKRTDDGLPRWRDFELEDFKDWSGWACVYDVSGNDPIVFSVRLWGTNVAMLMGFELTGKNLQFDQNNLSQLALKFRTRDFEFMSGLYKTTGIGLTSGYTLRDDRKQVHYQEIFLPLARGDTRLGSFLTVTHCEPDALL